MSANNTQKPKPPGKPKPQKITLKNPTTSAVTSMLSDTQLNLAIELAADLETPAETIKRYGITKKDFKVLAATDRFKQQFNDAKIAWGSPMNAKERVVAKTSMMTEASLLRINQLIHSTDTPPSNVIDAHKHISNLANMMPRAGSGSGEEGSRHSIIINIGNHNNEPKTIEVEGEVVEHE